MPFTKEEKERILVNLVTGMNTVNESLKSVEDFLRRHRAHPQVGSLRSRRLELEAEFAWLDRQFEAVLSGGGSLTPPDDPRVMEIADLSDEVAGLLRNQHTADLVLDASARAIELINNIRRA